MTIDYHSHCLPGIDDGAKTPDEGVELLKTLKSQGVDTVCLTPHFYASMKVDDFLRRRDAALEKLLAAAGGEELPKLVLGAEIHISYGLSEVKNLDKLTYEGTERMLLELPYEKFSHVFCDEIESLIAKYEIKPVMAHVERYTSWYDWPYGFLEKIDYYGTVYQFNVTSLAPFLLRRKIKSLLDEGLPAVFGSDTHSVKSRPPRFDLFVKHLGKYEIKNIFEK
ncbi:MAG: hypothetical protein II808_02945 [Clostridia bacterium]|nr:hypothetical protein [Clostridia bacterium]